jgi:hypothetical protein
VLGASSIGGRVFFHCSWIILHPIRVCLLWVVLLVCGTIFPQCWTYSSCWAHFLLLAACSWIWLSYRAAGGPSVFVGQVLELLGSSYGPLEAVFAEETKPFIPGQRIFLLADFPHLLIAAYGVRSCVEP